MTGTRRMGRGERRAQAESTPDPGDQVDALAYATQGVRLAEVERAHKDLVNAVLDGAPQEWDDGQDQWLDQVAVRYVRHLEHEVDRFPGGSRMPPWHQPGEPGTYIQGPALLAGHPEWAYLFGTGDPASPPDPAPGAAQEGADPAIPPAGDARAAAAPGAANDEPEAVQEAALLEPLPPDDAVDATACGLASADGAPCSLDAGHSGDCVPAAEAGEGQ